MNQSKEIMLKLSEFIKDMVKDALQSLHEAGEGGFSTLTTFLDYPGKIRSSIYTINILERANKKITRFDGYPLFLHLFHI